jgi:hypothetical protein
MLTNLVRDPDGNAWERGDLRTPDDREWSTDPTTGVYRLRQVRQDPDTRQWLGTGSGSRLMAATTVDTWETVTLEPMHDPRIDRLADLLAPVLDQLPAAQAAEIRDALDTVLALPEQWSRRRVAAYRNGARR